MKRIFKTISIILAVFSLHSCWLFDGNQPTPPPSTQYEPVIITRAQLENVSLQAPIATTKNAKIYLKDQYIFVNDSKKGFHVIDNTNPSQPVKIKFLNALGSTDVAIRNNVLYVNQARDLVALQINTNTNQVQVLKRLVNVFPPLASPNGQLAQVNDNQVVIDWKIKP